MQSYTAKQVDRMEIEEIEQLGSMMTAEELEYWCGWGYDGAAYVRLLKRPGTPQELRDEDLRMGAWCPSR